MNLPNYFLADLSGEATVNATVVSEACQALKRNRDHYLLSRTTESLISRLSDLAESWLEPEYPFRKLALDLGPTATGFPAGILARGLDTWFGQLTAENLHVLLQQDLGHAQRLDQFVGSDDEHKTQRTALATGPRLLVHITAGNLPNPALTSMVLGLLARSGQFVKCASGAALLPRLFAHSLYEVEPKLGACLEIAEWKGGRQDLEQVLFAHADCVTATGNDETLGEIRRHLDSNVRFLGYGQRVSFGFIGREALSSHGAKRMAAQAGADVVAWNQLGCLSPHAFYVEHGGTVAPERFAEMLASELAVREETEPRGEIAIAEAAAITARRSLYQIRAAAAPSDTSIWQSRDSTEWTVVYETEPQFQFSCLNRFIFVKAVNSLRDALQAAECVRGKVSTVGLAAPGNRLEHLATELARWGVTRICPVGQMQNPPLTWRHDGRPSLADLVAWTDWEKR